MNMSLRWPQRFAFAFEFYERDAPMREEEHTVRPAALSSRGELDLNAAAPQHQGYGAALQVAL